MNKIALTIVLAISLTAYIPNFFMDVNIQSSWFFAKWTDGALLQEKEKGGGGGERDKNRDNIERVEATTTAEKKKDEGINWFTS